MIWFRNIVSFFKVILRNIIPLKYRIRLEKKYFPWQAIFYYGNKVVCPIHLGHFRKFVPFNSRSNARCPRCHSLELHRLLWLYLKDKTNFFSDNLRILEVAPMEYIQKKYKRMKNLSYVSIDISSPIAMLIGNIESIPFADNRFDCVLCYRVLEYVEEDEKAMREIFRVLKPGGWAILQSLIDHACNKTIVFSDKSLSRQDKNTSLRGWNMQRVYGSDYKDKLEKAKFNARLDNYVMSLGDEAIKRYGLAKNEIIYFCTKPKSK